jgi:hypothetical protein
MTGRAEPSSEQLLSNLVKRLESVERSRSGLTRRFNRKEDAARKTKKAKPLSSFGVDNSDTGAANTDSSSVSATDSGVADPGAADSGAANSGAANGASDPAASNAGASGSGVTSANAPTGKDSIGLDIESV